MKDQLPASNGCVVAFMAASLLAVSLAATPSLAAAALPSVPAPIEVDGAGRQPPSDHDLKDENVLPPYVILGRTGRIRLTWEEKLKLALFGGNFRFGFFLFGPGPHIFTPGRLPQQIWNVSQIAGVLDGDELQNAPSVSQERILNSELAFDLASRRRGDAVGRLGPGVALRGVSALVLLDGVPVIDTYDGRVLWATMPQEGLARAELVPGGGATAWGNGALGGVIQFFTQPAQGQMVSLSVPPSEDDPTGPARTKKVIVGARQLTTTLGDFGTRSAEFVSSQPTTKGVVQVLGRIYRTDGVPVVATEQRGSIDSPAWNHNRWLEARWRQPLGPDAELVATVRGYDESYGAGTAYQQGGSRGTFASLALAGHRLWAVAWTAQMYFQGGTSTSRFSAVNASRTRETPVIDQFAVPTRAFGANWTGSWIHGGNTRTHCGVDLRTVQGESQDNVDFANGAFTHQLFAGGNQDSLGLFALHDREFTPVLHATIGARMDAWQERNGHRRETNRLTGAVSLDERYGSENGIEFGPNLGVVWQLNKAWTWRANGQQSFRRPTLSELYRTSGSDHVVIAANPGLQTEHNTSVEVASEYSFYREKTGRKHRPSPAFTLGVNAFVNELRDAISGVTVVRGTAKLPLLDALPSGYIGEKRINLDRARVQGLEVSAAWPVTSKFSLKAGLLFNDARIVRSALSPALEGNQIAQVPRYSAVLSSTWKVSGKLSLSLRVRSESERFLDSENALPLKATVLAAVGLNYRLAKHAELYFTADNLFNCRIESSRSADGLVYTSSPRIVLCGLKLKW